MATQGPDFVFRQVADGAAQAVQASESTLHFGYAAGIVTILVVALIAVTMIVVSTRWAVRTMLRSAREAMNMVERSDVGSAAPRARRDSDVSTTGIGRFPFHGGLFSQRYVTRSEASDPEAFARDILASQPGGNVWAFPSGPGAVTVVSSAPVLRSLRERAMQTGFRGEEEVDLELSQAEAVAEREAMNAALRSLSIVGATIGERLDMRSGVVVGMDVETLELPPALGQGHIVKRVVVRWSFDPAREEPVPV